MLVELVGWNGKNILVSKGYYYETTTTNQTNDDDDDGNQIQPNNNKQKEKILWSTIHSGFKKEENELSLSLIPFTMISLYW